MMRGHSGIRKKMAGLLALLLLVGAMGLSSLSCVYAGELDTFSAADRMILASANGMGTILAKAVKTGDETPLLLYVMILLVAAAAAVLVWSIIKTKDRRKGRRKKPNGPERTPVRRNPGQGEEERMDPRMNDPRMGTSRGAGPRNAQGGRTRGENQNPYQGNTRQSGQGMSGQRRGERMEDPDDFFPDDGGNRQRRRINRRPEE